MSLAIVGGVVAAGTAIYGANQAYEHGDDSKMAQDAARDAAAKADPFGQHRGYFGDMLQNSFGRLTSFDPSQIQNDPAYQFQMSQGINAIDKGAAAHGLLGSGNRLAALQEYGQGLASNFTDKQFGRNQAILQSLGALSGASNGSMAGAGNALLQGNAQAFGQEQAGQQNMFGALGGIASALKPFFSNGGAASSGANSAYAYNPSWGGG